MQPSIYLARRAGLPVDVIFPSMVEFTVLPDNTLRLDKFDVPGNKTKPTNAELNAALDLPDPQDVLLTYANGKQWILATSGYHVVIDGVTRTFATDAQSMGLVDGKANRLTLPSPPAPAPPDSVRWEFAGANDGDAPVRVVIGRNDFIVIAAEIADFVQATFDRLPAVESKIEDGTYATTDQIDAADEWPSSTSATQVTSISTED